MQIDFVKHNEETNMVWDAYHAGNPIRVPVGNFTIGPRIWLLDPKLNTEGITFHDFQYNFDTMFDVQLKYKYHLAHNIIFDQIMGIPEEGWEVFVEYNNVTEAIWFGCESFIPEGQIIATRHRYGGDNKNEIFDLGMPEPNSGIYATVFENYEYFVEKARNYEFYNKPVSVALPWTTLGTDGPLTVALDIRGDEIYTDMYLDEEYYDKLMSFIVDATINKVKYWRNRLGLELKPKEGGFSDDAIQLISTDTYMEKVYPYHKRILDELYDGGPFSMHLCGDVQRHLPTIIEKLNINHFDTGFPVNFETLRDEIGDDIHINGGVKVDILLLGTSEDVKNEAKRVLESGVTRGGKFILKEANNVPPRVPLENFYAMYSAAKEFGVYER